MKRRVFTVAMAALLSGSILFTSCIGSFGLTNKVLSWNQGLTKWVDELVFIALWIVPVYEVSMFVDGVVLNTIEFWTGSNPMAFEDGEIRNIETEQGVYVVEKQGDSYHIEKQGEEGSLDLVYDEAGNACYVESNGQTIRIK